MRAHASVHTTVCTCPLGRSVCKDQTAGGGTVAAWPKYSAAQCGVVRRSAERSAILPDFHKIREGIQKSYHPIWGENENVSTVVGSLVGRKVKNMSSETYHRDFTLQQIELCVSFGVHHLQC